MEKRRALRLTAVSLLAVLLSATLQSCGLLRIFGEAFASVCEGTLVVTTTTDKNDTLCTPDDCSLREAVITANGCPSTMTIEIPPGTYTLTLAGPDAGDASFGDLDITKSMSIVSTAGEVVIDGNGTDRVFDIRLPFSFASPETVEMRNIAIERGRPDGSGGGISLVGNVSLTLAGVTLETNTAGSASAPGSGGAIYAGFGTTLNMSAVLVTDNTAFGEGGGIFVFRDATVDAEDSVIARNRALDGYNGGGMYNRGDVVFSGRMTTNESEGLGGAVFNSGSFEMGEGQISGNSAGIAGGGVANLAEAQFSQTSFSGNQAPMGGGLYSYPIRWPRSGRARVSIAGGSFADNEATANGGGIMNGLQSLLILNGTSLAGNRGKSGGGIYNDGEAYLIETSVRGNRALSTPGRPGYGGGIDNEGTMTIVRSTLAENRANLSAAVPLDGSALFNTGPLTMHNVTVSGNVSETGNGAAIVTGGPAGDFAHVTVTGNSDYGLQGSVGAPGYGAEGLTLSNSIVATNGGDNCRVAVVSVGGNLFDDASCGTESALGDMETADAMLLPLSDNGGATHTHALDPASPAVDLALDPACLTNDQRGIARPQGPSCDAGAFELEESEPLSGSLPEGIPQGPTTCRFGPRPIYPPISYLREGQTVRLLNRNGDASWLEVESLDGQVGPCWVDTDLLEIPPLVNLFGLDVGFIPPEPTLTPTAKPDSGGGGGGPKGCLWYDGQQNIVCYPIGQCPVKIENSLGACDP